MRRWMVATGQLAVAELLSAAAPRLKREALSASQAARGRAAVRVPRRVAIQSCVVYRGGAQVSSITLMAPPVFSPSTLIVI